MSLAGAASLAAQTDQPAAATPAAPAAVESTKAAAQREVTDVLERFVSWLHQFVPAVDDTVFHWIACGIVLLAAILLRHVITNIIFHYLKKLASKTETTLDDKLFPAMESPVATLVMVLGIFAALTVLKLSEHVDQLVSNGATVAILGVMIWGVIRAGGALLDHMEEIAQEKQMTVATFMPLIKKTLFIFAVVTGVLLTADSLGFKVGVFLTSLGIAGMAIALAAQDTIANLFGSLVVVIDQPFKVGDMVKVGANTGAVEDIGLRSTKIRLIDKSLLIIPNKMMATEAITNLSRFKQRRVEQTLGLTYSTTPEQMEGVIGDIRKLLTTDAAIDASSVVVVFSGFSASSIDILVVYATVGADAMQWLLLRERINLALMKAVAARGLSFAFPTQTVQLEGDIARKLAERK